MERIKGERKGELNEGDIKGRWWVLGNGVKLNRGEKIGDEMGEKYKLK